MRAWRRSLTRRGTQVLIGGPTSRWLQPVGHMVSALAMSPFVSQRMVLTDTVGSPDTQQHLVTLSELLADRTITPVIDRRYPFEELPAAIRYQEAGHAAGKVVVTV